MLNPLRLPTLIVISLAGAVCSQSNNGAGLSTAVASRSNTSTSIVPALSTSTLSNASLGNATCLSRAANYITHTLPQQCLRTNRSTPSSGSDSNFKSSGTLSAVTESEAPSALPLSTTASALSSSASPSKVSKQSEQSTSTAVVLSSSTISEPSLTTAELPEVETDSPLDNAKFLSFEEWKRENLAKAGQSPDDLGGRSHPIDADRRRLGINNALDTLGEESEIELDFSGFGGGYENVGEHSSSRIASGKADVAQSSRAQPTLRSKDAGKTCKERTNYASFDCAATILKSNPEAKSGSSILVENKDSYLLNKCSAQNKFIIVELCNDILVDTLVLASYEYFSSIFRHFRVSVSDRYPVKMEKWKEVGNFEARNTREVQAFLIENPLIWARYLRIEFQTHYGNEYYCPVSLLRVHGTTMMDEFRHQEEIARGEPQDDEVVLESEAPAEPVVPQEPFTASPEASEETLQAIPTAKTDSETALNGASSTSFSALLPTTHAVATIKDTCPVHKTIPLANHWLKATALTCDTKASTVASTSPSSLADSSKAVSASSSAQLTSTSKVTTTSQSTETPGTIDTTEDSASSLASSTSQEPKAPGSASKTSEKSAITQPTSVSTSRVSSSVSVVAPPLSQSRNKTVSTSQNKATSTSTYPTRASPSNITPQQPQPSTQESFFKSVSKRLAQLESNSTLSLQYIEAQSLILRDAFSKVEKRQVSTTTTFLNHVNNTIMAELHGFRQAYDQIWQSTVLELEGQREQYQREMLALSSRLNLVADELVWQKRMGIVQSTLVLLCLAVVLFNRGAGATGNSAIEIPLLQHMLAKSSAAFRDSPPNSPSPDSRSSPVSLLRRKLWRHHTERVSGDATDGTDSRPQSQDGPGVSVNLEPPTPTSMAAQSEAEAEDDDGDDEWKDVHEEMQTQSGPATPNGVRENRPPSWPGEQVVLDDGGARPRSSLGVGL